MADQKPTKKPETKTDNTKEKAKAPASAKPEEKKEETKAVEKGTKQKAPKKEKTVAIARGVSLRISPKYAGAICKMIRGKTPEVAIDMLTAVTKGKKAVPMAAKEVPHQKGKGIAGAKFPKNAAQEIKRVTEQVRANAIVNGIENPVITLSKADRASGPFRVGGRRAKRAHVLLEVRDRTKLKTVKIN